MTISATGSRSTLTYLPEAVFGEIGEPALIWGEGSFVWGDVFEWGQLLFDTKYVRAKYGAKFELKRDTFISKELNALRQGTSLICGNRSGSGELPFEFSYGSFDLFLQAVMGGVWTGDVLKVGNRKRSFTFEMGYPDVNVFEQNIGVVLSSFNLSVKPNSVIEGSFTSLFKDQTSTATIDATPTIASSDAVYDAFTGAVILDSVPLAIMTGIDMKIDQSASASNVLFDATAQQISLGTVNITGTINVRFISNAMKAKFLSGDESSIVFTIGTGLGGGKSYSFDMPRIKYTTAITDTGEDVLTQSLAFTAIYDTTDGTTLTITRIP